MKNKKDKHCNGCTHFGDGWCYEHMKTVSIWKTDRPKSCDDYERHEWLQELLDKEKKMTETKEESTLDIVIEGHVYLEDKKKDGTIIERTQIDDKTILLLVTQAIEAGLDALEDINKVKKEEKQ